MPEHPIWTTLLYGFAAGLVVAGASDLLQVRLFHATLLGLGFWCCLAGYVLLLARIYGLPLRSLLLPLFFGTAMLCLLYVAHVRTFPVLLVDLLLFIWLRLLLFPAAGPWGLLLESVLGGACMLASVFVLWLGMGAVGSPLGLGLAIWLFFQLQALFFLWHPSGRACKPENRFEHAYLTAQRLLG